MLDELKERLPDSCSLFLLADTTFGSCCVDEVAAAHVQADLIIHFGESCLARPSRIPTLFVFERRAGSLDGLDSKIANFKGESCVVIFQTGYYHLRRSVPEGLQVACIETFAETAVENAESLCPTTDELSKPDRPKRTLVYVGEESLFQCRLAMSLGSLHDFVHFDPRKCDLIEDSVREPNRLLRRRLFLIEKAKEAEIFGVVVGTTSVCKLAWDWTILVSDSY